jgi:hypothetical protein
MIYNDYSEAYRLNQFDANNVDFATKLIIDSYIFNALHKPHDIDDELLEIETTQCPNGDDLISKGMGELMLKMKQQMRDEITSNLSNVMLRIEKICASDIEKINRIQEIFKNSVIDLEEYWRKLKDEGIKYFVVYHPLLNILCFCEEIEVI